MTAIADKFNELWRVPKDRELDGRQISGMVAQLLRDFMKDENISKTKSGTNEEYTALMDLCADCVAIREASHGVNVQAAQNNQKIKKHL